MLAAAEMQQFAWVQYHHQGNMLNAGCELSYSALLGAGRQRSPGLPCQHATARQQCDMLWSAAKQRCNALAQSVLQLAGRDAAICCASMPPQAQVQSVRA